jgi:hypothetical protein
MFSAGRLKHPRKTPRLIHLTMEDDMRLTKTLLSPLALAAALAVTAPVAAMAMPAAHAAVAGTSPAAPADYLWQGHHYQYHHNGHYYNHREKKDNQWSYY